MRVSRFLLLSVLLFSLLLATVHGGSDEDEDTNPTSSGDAVNLRSKSLILVKISCLIIVFLGTFLAGISPCFVKWNEGFLVLGTQFAGGVFLGTALMHFLSDSNENFERLTKIEYPFGFLLASAGYLMTMLADCVFSDVYAQEASIRGAANAILVLHQGRVDRRKRRYNGSSHPGFQDASTKSSLATASLFGDSIFLIMALCFHSVFEGIAIGIAKTKLDAWKALWSISLHKIFAAIAMGIALLRMIPDRPLLSCAAYAFSFAIASPIGVAIGVVIDATTQGRVADWIFAISMGLASGVFIYVSINYLLKGYTPHEKVPVDTLHYRFSAILLGVGVIALVMLWDNCRSISSTINSPSPSFF